MSIRWFAAATLLAALAAQDASARILRRPRFFSRGASGVSMRKRLHINGLITEPGNVELDFGGLFSYTSSNFTLPSALKYTPEGDSLFLGRTEYSVSFDSLDDSLGLRFSDRVTVAATSILFDSPHFDIAVAPQVTKLLRNDSGVRLGGTAVGRYDQAGNSLGFSIGWTGASTSSVTNPAGIWDIGAGYGRRLASDGFLSRITPHLNATYEKATGFERTVALFGGVEYQASPRIAFDVSGQRIALIGAGPDRQVLAGMTVTLGRIR